MRNNCWEFKNCTKMKYPTRTEEKLDGVHGDINGGAGLLGCIQYALYGRSGSVSRQKTVL
ncbi:MAG: hypothetical protein ACLPX5_13880 [Dissulfurispiraceae bacterium]